jgi:protein SCO1/2
MKRKSVSISVGVGRNWAVSARLFFLMLIPTLTLFSCGPKQAEEEFTVGAIPRLAKYYPEVDAKGDTTYAKAPVDSFINQHGDTFSTAALAGHVSVVQLFFTSCEGICPVISGSMSQVQKEFAGNKEVRLVSFSVDPARDSVPALKKYASRFSADSAQWMLLTGDKKRIYDLVRYGYRLPDIEPGTGGEEDFIHSDQLVLIDRNSIIRGYYGGTDTAQVRMLIEDVHTLLQE